MPILSSAFIGVEIWSVYYASIYGKSKLNFFKSIKFLGEISNNLPNDLLEIYVYKTLNFCWKQLLTILQKASVTSVISKQDTFSLFYF